MQQHHIKSLSSIKSSPIALPVSKSTLLTLDESMLRHVAGGSAPHGNWAPDVEAPHGNWAPVPEAPHGNW